MYGQAWCRTAADLVSGLASTPSHDRVSERSPRQHRRRSWRDGKRFFVSSCRTKCTYGAALAYRRKRRHRKGGPQCPRKGNVILVTNYPHRDSTPARTRIERYVTVPAQISFPGKQARPHTIASSKGAHTNIYDDLGMVDNTFPFQVVALNAFNFPFFRIAVEGDTT